MLLLLVQGPHSELARPAAQYPAKRCPAPTRMQCWKGVCKQIANQCEISLRLDFWMNVMDWMSASALPPNSYVEALKPNVMVLTGKAFRRSSGLNEVMGWGAHDGLSALVSRDWSLSLSLSCHISTQQEGSQVLIQARKKVLTRTQPCWHSDRGLPAARTVRNNFLLCKPPSL